MRTLALGMLCGLCAAQVRQPTDTEQTAIQNALHEVVKSVNERNSALFLSSTAAGFDIALPGTFTNRERLKSDLEAPPERLRQLELATLIRSVRMLSPEVAFGDGYYRTIHLAGGESAGRISVTLVRQGGKWLAATARFAPYKFDDDRVMEVRPAEKHASPGPDGWITLFDGTTTDAFVAAGGGSFPDSWAVEDGTLKTVVKKNGVGIRTRDTYDSFELRFEWKVAAKGNSGVKYRLFYLDRQDARGHEYQVVDDRGDPGAIDFAVERAGALYNQIAPSKLMARPVGQFNESTLIVRGRHCEHWLNGEKVVEYEAESDPLEGPILLQHHGSEVWFRNIRIRRLSAN